MNASVIFEIRTVNDFLEAITAGLEGRDPAPIQDACATVEDWLISERDRDLYLKLAEAALETIEAGS